MNRYVLAGFLFLLFVALVFFFEANDSKKLDNDFKSTKAIFNGLGNSRNAGQRIFIKYKFIWNGKMYYGNTGIGCVRSSRDKINHYMMNREMTVVFYPPNPKNSKVILSAVDFTKYNLKASKQDSAIITTLNRLCSKSPRFLFS